MSMKLDDAVSKKGTKFLVFPQPGFLEGFKDPETIFVSVAPSDIQPGPADTRMQVIDAVDKVPYSQFTRPPYFGPRHPPVQAGPSGHFDHLDVDNREFSSATMYATVRRVLDIWEDYFDRRIELPGQTMELIPLIEWDNAQSGVGFLEFGFGRRPSGGIDHTRPYCRNFDVLAHEMGHNIIFAEVGFPSTQATDTEDYGGFHESCGDLVAIVASLHFNTVTDLLLKNTHGNLFTLNELDRVGELSASREIRVAFNDERFSPQVVEPHDRSLPLTGGIFDVFVEVFQKQLVADRLITQDLATRSTHVPGNQLDESGIAGEFKAAFERKPGGFRSALLLARDYLGKLLAETWNQLSPDFLTYHKVYRALLTADNHVSSGSHATTIRECFAWREIPLTAHAALLQPRRLRECEFLDEEWEYAREMEHLRDRAGRAGGKSVRMARRRL